MRQYLGPSDVDIGLTKGVYLTEFRHVAHSRRIVATIL